MAENEIDHTKTRSYAVLDLFCKLVSSIGVIVIGVAGMLIQHRFEQRQEESAKSSRALEAARQKQVQNLVTLEGLVELELLFEDSMYKFRERKLDKEEGIYMRDLGIRITTVADGLFLENDQELSVDLTPKDKYGFMSSDDPKDHVKIPVRAAAIMAGEVLQVCGIKTVEYVEHPQQYHDLEEGYQQSVLTGNLKKDAERWMITFDAANRQLRMKLSDNTFQALSSMDPRSTNAWTKWYPSGGVLIYLMRNFPVDKLSDEMESGTRRCSNEIICRNPELGEKYQQIRFSMMSNRSLYLPPNRNAVIRAQ